LKLVADDCEKKTIMRKPNILTFLVLLGSLCTDASGQNIWQADTETATQGIIIQNSLPKGVTVYTGSYGKQFIGVTFWTRVVNETPAPLELTINFPADSFAIPQTPSYVKVFVLQDTMTFNKQSMYNYGLKDPGSFLDANFYKSTMLQRTVDPGGACAFYITVFSYKPGDGFVRAGFLLKDQNLFYRINMLDPFLIPCGKIVVKK
jgi:hypothetical protein